MIKKFTSGNPIDTQAVVEKFNALPIAEFPLGGKFENGNFVFEFDMADSDIVYGLGEAPRGINKRGWVYNSFCSDDPFHTETKSSLYAAHNFLIYKSSNTYLYWYLDFRPSHPFSYDHECIPQQVRSVPLFHVESIWVLHR